MNNNVNHVSQRKSGYYLAYGRCAGNLNWPINQDYPRPHVAYSNRNRPSTMVYCSVRDGSLFLRHLIRKYPDSPVQTLSDSLRINFFPLRRADLFFSGFAVEFAGLMWTVAVSGEKNLRVQKYPDTCGRAWEMLLATRSPRGHLFYRDFLSRHARHTERKRDAILL